MIVDNLGKRRERDRENGWQVFVTCLADFSHSLLSVYLFYICFLWENQ